MTVLTSIEKIEHRANIYKVLSVLYKQPTEEIEYYLEHLQTSIENVYPSLKELAEQLLTEYKLYGNDLTKLKIDHAKLFVGPFDLLAPPYSSIYLNEGRLVFGESTMEALSLYKQAGIEMAKDFKNVPDSISVELEFIYYLFFLIRENGEEKYQELLKSFIQKHLIKWVAPFTSKINESAKEDFYKYLANLLVQVVYLEDKELSIQ